MKLTEMIKATEGGLNILETQVERQRLHVAAEGKKLNELRAEYDAQREMLNAALKLQDLQPEGETITFRYNV